MAVPWRGQYELAGYAWIRLSFLAVHGVSAYQLMQLRTGPILPVDTLKSAFPPIRLAMVHRSLEPTWLTILWPVLWTEIGVACAWLLAYIPATCRNPQTAGWYWWRLVALMPLSRFHPHPHYGYLAGLAISATHGVMIWAVVDMFQAFIRDARDSRGRSPTAGSAMDC